MNLITCKSGKQAYMTPAEAARAVRLVASGRTHSRRARRTAPGAAKLSHYHCQFCKQWHIGHSIIGERA